MINDWTTSSCNIFNRVTPKVNKDEPTLMPNNGCECCFKPEPEEKFPEIKPLKTDCCKKQWAVYMYCENTAYSENDWVVKDGIFYKSLVDDNLNSIYNALYWKKVNLEKALYDIDPSENGKFVNGKLSMPIGTILLVPKSEDNKNLAGFIDLKSGEPIPKCYKDLINAVGETFPEPPGITDHELPVGSLVLHLAKDSVLDSVLGNSLQLNGWTTLKNTIIDKNSDLYLLLQKTNPFLITEISANSYRLDPTLGSREANIFPRIVTNNDNDISIYKEQSTLDLVANSPYLYLPPVVLSYENLPEKEQLKTGTLVDFKHYLGRDPSRGKLEDSAIAENSGLKSSYVLLGDRVEFYSQRTDYYVGYDDTFNYSRVNIFHPNSIYSKYLGEKVAPDSVGFNLLVKSSSSTVDLLKNYKYVILAFNKINREFIDIESLVKEIEASIDTPIKNIQNTLENLCGRVTLNTEAISTVKVAINTYITDLDVIRRELDELERFKTTIADLTAEIENLKAQLNMVDKDEDMSPECEQKLRQLTDKLDQYKSLIDTNTNSVNDLTVKVNNLEHLLTISENTGSNLQIKETDSSGFIPSDYIGKSNDYLLCTPDKLLVVNVNGIEYVVPAYAKIG